MPALDLTAPDAGATPIDGEQVAAHATTLLTFDLAGQKLAVDVRQVREILDLQPIARVPNAGSDVLGVIDVRGEAITMIDLGDRLGMRRDGLARDARIIVLEITGANSLQVMGFEADAVLSVVDVAPEAIEAVPVPTATRWRGAAVTGMTRLDGALFMIVDLEALLASDPMGGY
jgi:purine-binding chemotaxis protein CheW